MYIDIQNNVNAQRFAETVRFGWKLNPHVLEALKSGETTAEDQAYAYHDVDETEGLSIEEAAAVITYAMKSPEY